LKALLTITLGELPVKIIMKLALRACLFGICLFLNGGSNGTSLSKNGLNSVSVRYHPSLELQPCRLPNRRDEAKCGKYEVFEDRETKSGRKIALNILFLPALAVRAVSDPVFFLAGGPGQGAVAAAKTYGSDFMSEVRPHHDIVIIDQRGTGESNPLHCDLYGDKSDMQAYFAPLFPADKLRSCRTELEKIANLKLYTTSIAMDDFDEVREALGYRRINLVGGSYGTTAALIYLRRHPRQVRSMVLEGVTTPNFKLPLPYAAGAQSALDHLIVDCEADFRCQRAFPKFQTNLTAVIARVEDQPVSIELPNDITKKQQRVTISRESLLDALRLMLYSTDFASKIPLLIQQASQGDFVPFGKLAFLLNRAFAEQLDLGAYLSVTCAESIPFITEQEIVSTTAGTFIGDNRVRAQIAACGLWPRGDVPSDFMDPISSDVPVLMISGGLDRATPPKFGAAAVPYLRNSRQLVIRNASHLFNSKHVDRLVAGFISKGTVQGLNTAFAKTIRRPPFATKITKRMFDL
jgi:pimeloyl-ACP methyl ester carboxylesterase